MPSPRTASGSPATSPQPPAGATDDLLDFLASHGRATAASYDDGIQSPTRLLVGAARQQRLGVDKIQRNHHMVTRGDRVVGGFTGHLTSLASSAADQAALSIPTVRALLDRAQLPIPVGRTFSPEAESAAADWLSELDAAAVVKPACSEFGRGITRGVRNRRDLSTAWGSAVAAEKRAADADSSIVVERQHSGFDVRAFVVGEEVVAATARVPLFCIGDGESTLRAQITSAEDARRAHPHLGEHTHDALEFARDAGLPVDRVSEAGRPYLLGDSASARAGGVSVDVTDLLDDELQTLAVDAVWAIPGCRAAGVDLLVRSVESAHGGTILDVDSRANFTVHYYPWIGRRRPVAKSLIEQMVRSTGP